MANKRNKGWLYPLAPDPPKISVCVPIPDDESHIRAFLGAIRELGIARNWQWSETDPSLPSRVWSEIFDIVSQRIGVEFCEEATGGNCRQYSNLAGFVQYYPNDPRYSPDLVTDGYNSPAWYMATAASNLAYGTQSGDVVTSLDRFPPGSLPTIIPASGLPRVRIPVNLQPGGVIRTYWRNMIAGSILQVTVDDDVFTADFVDLNKDLVALPWESHPQVIHEWVSEAGGEHHLDYIIVSQINDQIPFLHHGGGLIRIEICGEVEEGETGMDCCDIIIFQNNQIITFNDNRANEIRIENYNGTPGSVNDNAPAFFNGNNQPIRETALCLAIERYMGHLLYTLMISDCAVGFAGSILITAAAWLLGGPLAAIAGGYAFGGAILNCQEAIDILNDPDARKFAICAVFEAMRGVQLTQANFDAAWANAHSDYPPAQFLIDNVNQPSVFLQNYTWFIDLLGEAEKAAAAGAEADCEDCQDDLCGPFDYRDSFPAGGYIYSYDNLPIAGARQPGVGMLASGGPTSTGRYAVAWRHPLDCEQTSEIWDVFITYENLTTIAGDRRIYVWLRDQAGNWIDKLFAVMTTVPGVHQASIPDYDMSAMGSSGPPTEIWVQAVEITPNSGAAIRTITLVNS